MSDLPRSVTITDKKLFIDGANFPWYIAEEGPTVERRDGSYCVVQVPIIVFTDATIFADLRTTEETP